jgi:hypothetical protein
MFFLVGLASMSLSCRHDPVEQAAINALPADTSANGPLHRSGQPCLLCHDSYGGATPFAVAGTVYSLDSMGKTVVPAPRIRVTVVDSNSSDTRYSCTNSAGNFYITSWDTITFPLSASAGGASMQSLVGRDGSCATCHTLPDATSLNPLTGAGRASAGVILVNSNDIDPTCPETP